MQVRSFGQVHFSMAKFKQGTNFVFILDTVGTMGTTNLLHFESHVLRLKFLTGFTTVVNLHKLRSETKDGILSTFM